MNIVISRRNQGAPPPQGGPVQRHSLYDKRIGVWARVKAPHSEDHTVDVVTEMGIPLFNVPVAVKEWVAPGDAYTSGERDLPPVDSRVFIIMPTGTFEDCFVLCSGFSTIDQDQKEAFMDEGKEKSRRRVYPGNWKTEYLYATGTFEAVSPDEKTSLKIDYGTEEEEKEQAELHMKLFEDITADVVEEDNITINAYDTRIVIKEGEVTIDAPKTTVRVVGAALYQSGDTDIKSDAPVGVEGTETKLGGDVLQKYWEKEIEAWSQWPAIIPASPLPPGAPVPPAPPLINMMVNGLKQSILQMDTAAKADCAKALK